MSKENMELKIIDGKSQVVDKSDTLSQSALDSRHSKCDPGTGIIWEFVRVLGPTPHVPTQKPHVKKKPRPFIMTLEHLSRAFGHLLFCFVLFPPTATVTASVNKLSIGEFKLRFLSCLLSSLNGRNFGLGANRTHYFGCLCELAQIASNRGRLLVELFSLCLPAATKCNIAQRERVEEATSYTHVFPLHADHFSGSFQRVLKRA